jgi:hypothetical protein
MQLRLLQCRVFVNRLDVTAMVHLAHSCCDRAAAAHHDQVQSLHCIHPLELPLPMYALMVCVHIRGAGDLLSPQLPHHLTLDFHSVSRDCGDCHRTFFHLLHLWKSPTSFIVHYPLDDCMFPFIMFSISPSFSLPFLFLSL